MLTCSELSKVHITWFVVVVQIRGKRREDVQFEVSSCCAKSARQWQILVIIGKPFHLNQQSAIFNFGTSFTMDFCLLCARFVLFMLYL